MKHTLTKSLFLVLIVISIPTIKAGLNFENSTFLSPDHSDDSGFLFEKDNSPIGYIYESFNLLDNGSVPPGWETGGTFNVRASGGVNNSKRFARRIFDSQLDGYWKTPLVALGDDPVFRLKYRVVNDNVNYPANPTSVLEFLLTFKVSVDNGESYTTIIKRGDTYGHVEQSDYQEYEYSLNEYAGQNVILLLEVTRPYEYGGPYWVDFDDIVIGSFFNAAYTVTNGTNPINGALISIPGTSFPTVQTDMDGKANMSLPSGAFNFNVSAENYLTLSNASITVADQDVTYPEIELIGNFVKTFSASDQVSDPMQGVMISYEGTAQSYSGPVSVNGSITTNASGIASLALANGEYSFTATKANYYQSSGTFVMNNEASVESIQMQIFPLITFTVLGEVDEGDPEPLQNASVYVSNLPALLTNASGQITARLPIGDYSYLARKIGFIEGAADFNIVDNNDLALPPLTLALSPPVLTVVTPEDLALNFPKTLEGQVSAALSVVFTNTGSGIIEVEPAGISLTGPDSSEFLLTNLENPVSLSTGQQAAVSLMFSPVSAGAKTATLEIEDNQGNKTITTIAISGEAYSGTLLPFTEKFDDTGFNNWFVVNGTQTNKWHIGEPSDSPGVTSAMVSDDGITNKYNLNAATQVHFYQDFSIPAFENGQVKVNFDWKALGESTVDRMRVFLVDPMVNLIAGSTPSGPSGSIVLLGNFNNNSQWQNSTINIPEARHGKDQRLVFTWVNNNFGGNQPPAAVDNIFVGTFYDLLLVSNPPDAGVLMGQGSYRDGFNIPIEATAADGYTFSNWTSANGIIQDPSLSQTTFQMPSQSTTVVANFTVSTPVTDDLLAVYDSQEKELTAIVPSGFDVVWYNAATDGELVSPVAIAAGVYEFWASARDGNGFESGRVKATLTIEKVPLEITAEPASKTYGAPDPAFTYNISDGELFGEDQLSGSLSREVGENAGSYPIEIGSLDNPNYLINLISSDLEIIPAPLVVTANDKVKYFDGEVFPVENYTVSYSGFRFSDNTAVLGGTLEFGGDAVDATQLGEYQIIPSGLVSENYTISYLPGTLTISEKIILIVEGIVVIDKIYDGISQANLDFENTMLLGVDSEDDVALITSGVIAEYSTINAGDLIPVNYSGLTIGGDDSDKYILSLPTLAGSILKRPIEVTANAGQSKILGQADPDELTFSITQSSLVAGDMFTGILIREEGETVGVYDILIGSLALSDNYDLQYVGDVFTIYALLTLEVIPSNGGAVSGGGQYLTGDQVSIEATPVAGYQFLSWTDHDGNIISNVSSFDYTMPGESVTLTANFELAPPQTYQLVLLAEPDEGGIVSGQGEFEATVQVTITATANINYVFLNWSENGTVVSTDASYTLEMPDRDLTLTASFELENSVEDVTPVNISVFPNPARDYFNVGSESIIRSIVIADITGKVVYNDIINDTQTRIYNAFETGIYILRIYTDEGVFVRKLQIQK